MPFPIHSNKQQEPEQRLLPSLSFLLWSHAGCLAILPDTRINIQFYRFSWKERKPPTRRQPFWASRSSLASGAKENGSLISRQQSFVARSKGSWRTKKRFRQVLLIKKIIQLRFDFQRIQIEVEICEKLFRENFSKLNCANWLKWQTYRRHRRQPRHRRSFQNSD